MRPVGATGLRRKLPSVLGPIFRRTIIRDLSVEVVDWDGSKASSSFVDAIHSAPGIKVVMRSCELCEAEAAVRCGKAIAAVYIPENFERDIFRGRRPHVIVLFNKRFFAARTMTSNSIQAAISAAAADLDTAPHGGLLALGSVVVEHYVAPHPAVECAQLLEIIANPVVPTGVLATLGGLVGRILLSGRPTPRVVGQLAFFLALTALLLYRGTAPDDVDPTRIAAQPSIGSCR